MTRWLVVGAILLAVGCGGESISLPPVDGELRAPTPREARVTVTPVLDLTDAGESSQSFVVDQLVINLADVRILGEDPGIPAGGYPLLDDPRLVYAEGEGAVGIELPFPPEFLEHEGLAIYLRTEPSQDLDGSSVTVSGRWAQSGSGSALTGVVDPDGEPVLPSDEVVDPDGEPVVPMDGVVDPDGEPVIPNRGVVDPDGEPVRPHDGVVDPDGEPVRDSVVDPDGEPVRDAEVDPDGEPVRDAVVDPDGEPVRCDGSDCGQTTRGLKSSTGVPVVLKELGVVELVVTIDRGSRFNLVFGVPLSRWLDIPDSPSNRRSTPLESVRIGEGPIVLVSDLSEVSDFEDVLSQSADGDDGIRSEPADDYYLADGLPIEDAVTQAPGL